MDELKREVGPVTTPPWGTVGVFDSPAAVLHASEALRDAGYKALDANVPFPVHGLDRALGHTVTKIPWISLGGAAFGLGGMVWLSYYVSYDYPFNISGKPVFSYQAYVPLYFELMVLFCAFATFFGLWGLCRLPAFFHPVMQHKDFPRVTDDRFLVSVEASDPRYDAVKIKELMEQHGGHDVEEVMS